METTDSIIIRVNDAGLCARRVRLKIEKLIKNNITIQYDTVLYNFKVDVALKNPS